MSGPTLQLVKRVPELLREQPERRFKARELAQLIRERFPDECRAKLERSAALQTEDQLLQQIVAEIGAQRPQMQQREPHVRTTEGRPRRYYWSDKSEAEEAEALNEGATEAPTPSAEPGPAPSGPLQVVGAADEPRALSEHDLYPLLGEYLAREAGVDAMAPVHYWDMDSR